MDPLSYPSSLYTRPHLWQIAGGSGPPVPPLWIRAWINEKIDSIYFCGNNSVRIVELLWLKDYGFQLWLYHHLFNHYKDPRQNCSLVAWHKWVPKMTYVIALSLSLFTVKLWVNCKRQNDIPWPRLLITVICYFIHSQFSVPGADNKILPFFFSASIF